MTEQDEWIRVTVVQKLFVGPAAPNMERGETLLLRPEQITIVHLPSAPSENEAHVFAGGRPGVFVGLHINGAGWVLVEEDIKELTHRGLFRNPPTGHFK